MTPGTLPSHSAQGRKVGGADFCKRHVLFLQSLQWPEALSSPHLHWASGAVLGGRGEATGTGVCRFSTLERGQPVARGISGWPVLWEQAGLRPELSRDRLPLQALMCFHRPQGQALATPSPSGYPPHRVKPASQLVLGSLKASSQQPWSQSPRVRMADQPLGQTCG